MTHKLPNLNDITPHTPSDCITIVTKSTTFKCTKSEILLFVATEREASGNKIPTIVFKGGYSYAFEDLLNLEEELPKILEQLKEQWG